MANSTRGAVVVTGASTGIGEASALYLDQLGFHVYAGVRKDSDGDALRSKASNALRPIRLDVTDAASIEEAAAVVGREIGAGGLAGLVNNAGVSINGPLEFLPIDLLRKQLEINVVGQVAVTQAFLGMLRAAKGRVVNVGSTSGRLAVPFGGPYCASKFAMEAISDSLRMELKPWGIEVVCVEPGAIATPIWEKSIGEAKAMLETMPAQLMELYGPLINKVLDAAVKSGQNAAPVQVVAEAVAHALTASRPKTRYVVGKDARLQMLLSYLPDRLRDSLILKFIDRAV